MFWGKTPNSEQNSEFRSRWELCFKYCEEANWLCSAMSFDTGELKETDSTRNRCSVREVSISTENIERTAPPTPQSHFVTPGD